MRKLTVQSVPLANTRFEHTTLRVTAPEALKVTGFRWEGLPVESPNWFVYDLRVNGRSWFRATVERGLPADLFTSRTVERFVEFGDLNVGDGLEIDVVNLWDTPKVFAGSFVGVPQGSIAVSTLQCG